MLPNLINLLSIGSIGNMFTSNFSSTDAVRAAYNAARRQVCNPGINGRCRPSSSGSALGAMLPSSASTFGIFFYISLFTFIIFLILVCIHYTMFPIFALSVNDPGLILIPTSNDSELSYKTDSSAAPTKRRDTDTGIALNKTKMPACCNYTIGVDILIDGGLTPITHPNVILYRDVVPSSVTAATAATATKANLNTKYANTNIIIWLDNDTNNLNVSLVTGTASGNEQLQHLPSIENVPLNKKFRLVVVLADSFVEVYINGGLEQSMQINGNLKGIGTSTSSTDFYPSVIDSTTSGVKITNMSMWPRVITSKEIRTYEATPMTSS